MRHRHVTETQILARLQSLAAYDRNLFIEHLAETLGTLPTPARLKALAHKAPKAHAEYVATYARLAGFTERTESLNMHLIADLSALSDVDLQARLSDMTQQLKQLSNNAESPVVIDVSASNPHTEQHEQKVANVQAQARTRSLPREDASKTKGKVRAMRKRDQARLR